MILLLCECFLYTHMHLIHITVVCGTLIQSICACAWWQALAALTLFFPYNPCFTQSIERIMLSEEATLQYFIYSHWSVCYFPNLFTAHLSNCALITSLTCHGLFCGAHHSNIWMLHKTRWIEQCSCEVKWYYFTGGQLRNRHISKWFFIQIITFKSRCLWPVIRRP